MNWFYYEWTLYSKSAIVHVRKCTRYLLQTKIISFTVVLVKIKFFLKRRRLKQKLKLSFWNYEIKVIRRSSICSLSICQLSICRLSICRLSIIRPPYISAVLLLIQLKWLLVLFWKPLISFSSFPSQLRRQIKTKTST